MDETEHPAGLEHDEARNPPPLVAPPTERERWEAERATEKEKLSLLRREATRKDRELEDARRTKFTPVAVAFLGLFATIAGAAIGALVQLVVQDRTSKAAEVVAARQFEHGLIKDATNHTPEEARERLKFLLNFGFLVYYREGVLVQVNQDPSREGDKAPIVVDEGKPVPPTNAAIESYEIRLKQNKRDTDALILLGFALYKVGRMEEAKARLDDALEILPRSRWGLYNAALVSCRAERYGDADMFLTRLLAVDKNFEGIIKRHKQFEDCRAASTVLKTVLKDS